MSRSRTSAPPARPPARQAARMPAYTEHARCYEQDTSAFQPYRQAIVEALPLRPGQVVLDVGCGTGLCFGPLRDKVTALGGVVGIEESPEMAAVARDHIAAEGWLNVTVVESRAEDAEMAFTADAALFCAVHDIMQSPDALRNVRGPGWPRAAASGPRRSWWP